MSAAAPGPDTPYWRAVLALFERIGATLPATLPAPVRAIRVGGAAAHVHTGARVSRDVEAIFSHRILLPQDLVVRYTDEAGLPRQVDDDYSYFSDVALLHPEYDRDAVVLGRLPSYPLVLAVRAPVDLAVSKRARFQDQDRSDRASLARCGLPNGPALPRRVEEALGDSVGDSRWLRYNLRDALAPIDANTPAPVPRRGSAPRSFHP